MASAELCQCCLRENEEEVADHWCNDCSEAVCRNCGKAHRRFAVAHDVISIKDVPAGVEILKTRSARTYGLDASSSENKLFFAVKHLDNIQIKNEKKIDKIKKDFITGPLDDLPVEGINYIEKKFLELRDKTKLKTKHDIIVTDRKCVHSQNIEEVVSLNPISRYQELTADSNSIFGALCFTEDGRIVVEESKTGNFAFGLRIFDLQTKQSTQITLSEISDKINMMKGSSCMFDKNLALVATSKVIQARQCIPGIIADIEFDDSQVFIHTEQRANDKYGTSAAGGTYNCYS
ncbi:unnamed protein product [Mytilus edulis]|uniref:B box-type domain-containing protein n=1 Tax=Mytilus edulis TaxID=6550 RepID=A0A8S3PUN8_MYTED|nr:unnamed protein product [Mytilus edulis]